MKKLKIILQYKTTYIILGIFLLLYVLIFTIFIKYESKFNNPTSVVGIITDLNIKEDKISFTLKANEKIICNYYISNSSDYANLLGKKVKVEGKIKEIDNNTISNTFNYKKYLYQNKIYYTYTVTSLEILEEENIFYKIKNKIIDKINYFEDDIKTYLTLFILGDKSNLDENMYNNYQNNGIWHLFAISGMHISLIILVLDKIFQKIKFKNIIISLFLVYFMFLTNFSASVIRATLFFLFNKASHYFNLNISNIKILFLVMFSILIYNPFMIYNIGFEYSFLITFSIMIYSEHITGNYFMKILKISILSFLVGLPITINLNYEINLLSIILNVFYVPFISFIVFPLSIMTFIFPIFSEIFELFIYILESTNHFFNNLKLNIVIPKLSYTLIIIYYMFLYLYIKCKSKKVIITALCIITFNKILPKIDNSYYVNYLDINQGDSTILISPYQKDVVMIDTGGLMFSDYKVSNNTIKYLKSLGINKIDTLILSHGDYDHMGEAINLVNNFKVEKVIFNCGPFNSLEEELIKILDNNTIAYATCIKELKIGNNQLQFLNNEIYNNENDNSSVIYGELNNYKFLFMGDAGVDVEAVLIERFNLKNIDVLKIGHHGSRTSSSKEFINEINPKYSVISVGKNNRYGHPNKDVLNNLNHSKIYRTDKYGSIIFKIKNNELSIKTYSP